MTRLQPTCTAVSHGPGVPKTVQLSKQINILSNFHLLFLRPGILGEQTTVLRYYLYIILILIIDKTI